MRVSLMMGAVSVCALCACSAATPGIARESAPAQQTQAQNIVATNDHEAFSSAIKHAQPGDTITLANGVWTDFDMVVEAIGTKDMPITIQAETPGQVVLTGQSSLRIGGAYITVSGLYFRDGFTPRSEVISFRRDSQTLAFNSRVTNTVIENYSNPDRSQTDIWVAMYGQNNTFDHNYLAGKLNAGVTMAVRLNSEDSLNNGHQIRSNYFGPRPVKGSNGGETLRIGTSHYSLETSGTLVEGNYFERCSGEVEIVSNKSGGNVYRGNTFKESRGTLTLRHGSNTLVENNLFDGGGLPYTGGVRVINGQQTIRNNYFKNLTGERFGGALVVMNGVPNSPINRYHQVEDAVIEHNTFENIVAIELGEGSDTERSAVPVGSVFQNNVVLGSGEETPFNIHDDVSGIAFSGNVTNLSPPANISDGFVLQTFRSTDAGLTPVNGAGASGTFGVDRDATGPDWFEKPEISDPFSSGRQIAVSPGDNSLSDAINSASAGDTLVLAPGEYSQSRIVSVPIPVTIRSEGQERPVIRFERPNLFALSGRGALRLQNLEVSGEMAHDFAGNSVITSEATGSSGNHIVEISDSLFRDLNVNRSFSVVSAKKGTFFDTVRVENSVFSDVSGTPFKFDVETDDLGIYDVEYLIVENSRFERIGSSAISVYRGGRDESTFGPHVWVNGNTFTNVGTGGAPLMALFGAQNIQLENNAAQNASAARFTITTGKPVQIVSGNRLSIDGAEAEFLETTDLRN